MIMARSRINPELRYKAGKMDRLRFCCRCLVAVCHLSFWVWSVDSFAGVPEIESTYASIQDLQADFIQSTYVEMLDTTIKEPGIFMMKRPGKMRIEYTGEHPKRYITDGRRLWIMDRDLQQVETYNIGSDTIPREALEFLKGFSEMGRLFTVETWKPKKETKGNTYLRLTPRSKRPQYKWLDCEFGTDNILKTMIIHNRSGNVSTYSFNNVRLNSGLSDSFFTYKE